MSTAVGDGIYINTDDLQRLAIELRTAEPEVKANFRASLKEAAEVVAHSARIISGAWSGRIEYTIKVQARGVNVSVRAGGPEAPHAAVFEHGGVPGTFRHPVFGNRNNWVSQAARPFLAPALEANTRTTVELVERAVMEAFASIGFR